MPRSKTKRIDQISSPNFLLLKRLIEFEITGSIAVIPTREEVYQFFFDNKFLDEERRKTLAEKVRRFIWQPAVNQLTESDLDDMVKVANSLVQFKSWHSFNIYFGDLNTTDKYPRVLSLYYNESRERDLLQDLMSELYYFSLQSGSIKKSPFKQPILFKQQETTHILNNFRIKKISRDEIRTLFNHLKKCAVSHASYADLLKWHDKNENIFYSCIDTNYETDSPKKYISFMTVLPMKKSFFDSLNPVKAFHHKFNLSDIHYSNTKKISHLLIEIFVTYRISAINVFISGFRNILENIGNFSDDLQIYAFACTENIRRILYSLGFSALSITEGSRDGYTIYPLFCIKWKDLNNYINNKNELLF